MRHFRCSPLAIAALACGVGEAAPARPLVTPTGFALGMTAGGLRAPRTAVDIAPVAVAADHYLAATTGTVEQTRTALHRLLLPMRAGLEPNPERYSRVGRAAHGLGARYRQDCGGRDRCRACLNGPLALTDSAQPVTSLRLAASHYTPGLCPFRDRCSPPSSVIRRAIHRLSAGLRNRRHPSLRQTSGASRCMTLPMHPDCRMASHFHRSVPWTSWSTIKTNPSISTSAPNCLTVSPHQIGEGPFQARAGSCFSGSTAQPSPSSTAPGGRATSRRSTNSHREESSKC